MVMLKGGTMIPARRAAKHLATQDAMEIETTLLPSKSARQLA